MLSAKVKSAVLASLVMVASLSVNAAAGGNVAVVDIRSVVEGSKHFDAMQKSMQKKLGDKHQELIIQQKKLAEEQSALEKSKAVTASATYSKKQADLEKKQEKLAESERAFQEQVMKLQDESMKKLYNLVKSASTKIATAKGFEIVLQAEPLYVKSQYDITKEVKTAVENSKLA